MNGEIQFRGEEPNDGGPAFPQPGVYDASRDQVNPVNAYYDAGGMTLRDYFAAQAIPGILYMVAHKAHDARDFTGRSQEDKLALDAYRLADAMLVARSRS